MIRQGDVLLVPRLAPKGVEIPPTSGGHVLMSGQTGHSHTLMGDVRLYESAATRESDPAWGVRIADVTGLCVLKHLGIDGTETGEHGAHEVPVGTYLVVTQSQYQRGAVRNVED